MNYVLSFMMAIGQAQTLGEQTTVMDLMSELAAAGTTGASLPDLTGLEQAMGAAGEAVANALDEVNLEVAGAAAAVDAPDVSNAIPDDDVVPDTFAELQTVLEGVVPPLEEEVVEAVEAAATTADELVNDVEAVADSLTTDQAEDVVDNSVTADPVDIEEVLDDVDVVDAQNPVP